MLRAAKSEVEFVLLMALLVLPFLYFALRTVLVFRGI